MLKQDVMVADEWHNNGPQGLITVSLCIEIAIDKMQLCSLSIAYASPYHKPTATRGTLLTTLASANHLPTQRHTCGLQL